MLISSSALKLTECEHNFEKTVCRNNHVLCFGTENYKVTLTSITEATEVGNHEKLAKEGNLRIRLMPWIRQGQGPLRK